MKPQKPPSHNLPPHSQQSRTYPLPNPPSRNKNLDKNLSKNILWRRVQRNLLWVGLLLFVWLMCSGQAALAETLTERQQAFPNWQSKPAVQASEGDLIYPEWMAGSWRMTSTLVDMVAPLAPEIITPGFEGNRQFLAQPIPAVIRFVPAKAAKGSFLNRPLNQPLMGDRVRKASRQEAFRGNRENSRQIVADRAFNGLSLARAYLGKEWVKAVKADPDNPNRQITFLKGNQQLISSVTGRRVETPNDAMFATTEIFQQYFRNPKGVKEQRSAEGTARSNNVLEDGPESASQVYLNEVENTTIYRKQSDPNFPIGADQITAIYLSPQDPNYFKAKNRPVALYRYQLSFSPL
jgi:hypothetical protein